MTLEHVISVEEAAEKWGLSPTYVKQLAREGKIIAKKIGDRTWAIDANQPNPSKKAAE